MRKSLEKLEELARHLASHAEDVNTRVSDEPPDSLDDDFDELMEARDVMGRIRKLSGSHIVHLARHAQKRMEQAMMEEQAELEAKMKGACPPRDIRDFRMVRFSDAREGRKEKARTGMLNVWDARGLDLVEGKRFLVGVDVHGCTYSHCRYRISSQAVAATGRFRGATRLERCTCTHGATRGGRRSDVFYSIALLRQYNCV